VVPFVYVPFPIIRPYQSLFSILEFFIILVLVLTVEDTESSAAAAPPPCSSLPLVNPALTLIRVNTVYSISPPQCLRRINQCSPRTSRRAVTRMAINGTMACSTAALHVILVSYRRLHCPSSLRSLVENIYKAS
jgi:hypothetical protein